MSAQRKLPRLIDVEAERDELRATCAAMREALMGTFDFRDQDRLCCPGCDGYADGHFPSSCKVAAALSTTAGSDFTARIQAEEREACAKLADEDMEAGPGRVAAAERWDGNASGAAAFRIARAIRARGGA